MSRTERFLQLQNIKAHYKNMLEVEPTYIFPREKKRKAIPVQVTLPLKLDKAAKNREIEIAYNNHKLFQQLKSIGCRRSSTLQPRDLSTHHSERRHRDLNPSNNLNTMFLPSQCEKIQRENLIMFKKIKEAEPSVVMRAEWKKHYKKHKETKRMLSHHYKDVSVTKQSVNLSQTIDGLRKKLKPHPRGDRARMSVEVRPMSGQTQKKHSAQSNKLGEIQQQSNLLGQQIKLHEEQDYRYDDSVQEEIAKLKELEIYNDN